MKRKKKEPEESKKTKRQRVSDFFGYLVVKRGKQW